VSHTIMVVDDDPDDMEITRRILARTRREMIVTQVPRGETALALLRESRELPSLMLLDLKMPGMSGIDTLRRMREDEGLKHIPVVIVTNSTLESDRNAALNAGADGFIHKDFDMDQFGRDMKALLDRWLKDE
jgi:two-component system, response regulator